MQKMCMEIIANPVLPAIYSCLEYLDSPENSRHGLLYSRIHRAQDLFIESKSILLVQMLHNHEGGFCTVPVPGVDWSKDEKCTVYRFAVHLAVNSSIE